MGWFLWNVCEQPLLSCNGVLFGQGTASTVYCYCCWDMDTILDHALHFSSIRKGIRRARCEQISKVQNNHYKIIPNEPDFVAICVHDNDVCFRYTTFYIVCTG